MALSAVIKKRLQDPKEWVTWLLDQEVLLYKSFAEGPCSAICWCFGDSVTSYQCLNRCFGLSQNQVSYFGRTKADLMLPAFGRFAPQPGGTIKRPP